MLSCKDCLHVKCCERDAREVGGVLDHSYAEKCDLYEITWFPVSERLPQHGERVLACSRRGSVQTCRYEGRYVKGKGVKVAFFKDCNKQEMKVTHWMPLPEKAKEE